MKLKNAFSTLLTVLITAVAVGVLVGVITYSYAVNKKDVEGDNELCETAIEEPETTIPRTTTTVPVNIQNETINWKTYTNEKYGFSFKYPGEWEVLDNPIDIGVRPKSFKGETPFSISILSNSLQSVIEDTKKALKLMNSEIIEDHNVEKYGKTARMLTIKQSNSYLSIQYFFEPNNSQTIIITGESNDSSPVSVMVGRILNTFKFTK